MPTQKSSSQPRIMILFSVTTLLILFDIAYDHPSVTPLSHPTEKFDSPAYFKLNTKWWGYEHASPPTPDYLTLIS